MVRLVRIKKSYEGREVLNIPHLEFECGKIYCLYGPNGAGKTTLLNIMGLLDPPDCGKILFDGKEAGPRSIEARRRIGYLSENPLLFHTSVFENVAYPLKLRGIGKEVRYKEVLRILDELGLEGFANRKAHSLSGGEVQKVALARVLVYQPDLLLLDEPTSNVDRSNTEWIERLIQRVNSDHGTTIIFTTHLLEQVKRLAHETIFLVDGKIDSPPNTTRP
jgi:tungstate transport system ATP-binding protein